MEKENLEVCKTDMQKKMAKFGLARGVAVELTGKSHMETKEYYKLTNQAKKNVNDMLKTLNKNNIDNIEDVKQNIKQEIEKLHAELLSHKKTSLDNVEIVRKIEKDTFKLTLKENKKEEFKKILETIKEEIPIHEFVINNLEYEKDKNKSSNKHLVLKHHLKGNILVPTQRSKSGHWLYYEIGNESKKGGSLIDLLLKHNWSWSKIRDLADNRDFSFSNSDYKINNLPKISGDKQTQLAENLFEETLHNKKSNYLMKRGINPNTFKNFSQVKTDKYSAIFALYTNFPKENPRLCSTIRYISNREGITKKFFQKNLSRGLSVLKNDQFKPSKVVIFESPIDALSYRQLELKELDNKKSHDEITSEDDQKEVETKVKELQSTMYISTCGSITENIKKDLTFIFEKGYKVVLSFDNDAAGKKMTKTLENILKKKDIGYEVAFAKQGKDWNDELNSIKNNGIFKVLTNKDVLTRNYERIPQSNFKNSILCKSGIKEITIKDLEGIKYDEKRTVFKLYKYNSGKLEFNNLFSIGIKNNNLEKKFFNNKNNGLVILNKLDTAKRIVFSCSPIDLLKYRQVQVDLARINMQSNDDIKSTAYVSNCFNKSENVLNQIEEIIIKNKGIKLEVATTRQNMYTLHELCERFKDESYTKTDIRKSVSLSHGVSNTIFSIIAKLRCSNKIYDNELNENEEKKFTKKL